MVPGFQPVLVKLQPGVGGGLALGFGVQKGSRSSHTLKLGARSTVGLVSAVESTIVLADSYSLISEAV